MKRHENEIVPHGEPLSEQARWSISRHETWQTLKRTQISDTIVEMLHRETDMSVYNLTRLREYGTNQVRVPLLIV